MCVYALHFPAHIPVLPKVYVLFHIRLWILLSSSHYIYSLLIVPHSGGWLELKFWSCEKTCGYHVTSPKWRTSVYFALPDDTSSCSSLHYIHIYLRGAYLSLLLISLFFFISLLGYIFLGIIVSCYIYIW